MKPARKPKRASKMKPLEIRKYEVHATLTIQVSQIIEADSEADAIERGESMNGGEWLDHGDVECADADIDWAQELFESKARKP